MSRVTRFMVVGMMGIFLILSVMVSAAPMGTAITYQGRLTDGESPANGPYDFEFKVFDALTNGIQLDGTQYKENVPVNEGYFTVVLDFGNDPNVFNGEARWLTIGVRPGNDSGSYTPLSPRQEMTPTPYAIYAANAGSDNDWTIAGNDMFSAVSGNVGIGTTSPVWELEVANLTAGDGAESGVTANDAGGAIAAYSSTFPAPFAHFAGRVSLFSDAATMGLDLRADGSAGDMRFYTGGPWPFNERMRITSNGGTRITSYRDDGLGSWEEGLYFANNSNGLGPWSHAGIWADGVSGFNGELVFGVDGDDTNNLTGIQEAMRIDKSGNVGIGTTNPNDKLEVNGAISTGNGGIRWKTFSGTMDADHNTEFAHGLDASKMIHASCSFYVPSLDVYMMVPDFFNASRVYWDNTFIYLLDEWADGMLAGQPYRCVVMYVR